MPRSASEESMASRHHSPAEGCVRVGPLMNLPALLSDLGHDPAPLFAAAGFDASRFADPDYEIDFVAGSRLLARCVAATGCDQLGLLLGQRGSPSSLGVAGFMLQSAATVGAALQALVDHLDLHDRGATVALESDRGVTLLSYAIHLPGVKARDQIHDLAMTVVCRIMRTLCGQDWVPSEVLLSRRPPPDAAPYRQFFAAQLRFNADHNAVVFASRWLERPLAGADPLLHRHLQQQANDIQRGQRKDLADEVRRLLHASLPDQHDAADIAGQLGLHQRSLNRRLREQDTSFRQQLEQVRYELAQQRLADSSMSHSAIAVSLGYSDTTAFSRAFKRWSGQTPSVWRSRHAHSQ